MITPNARFYNYYQYQGNNEYGQATLSTETVGTVKMSIYPTSTSIQDNINYKDANYIGFTFDKYIDDTYVIEYEGQKLKVLYIVKGIKLRQVYMALV